MNSLVDKTIKFIFSKKKQILFALFALICIILDKESSSVLLRSAAPAVVAAAATGSTAAGGTAITGTAAASTATAGTATAGTAATGTSAAGTATAGTTATGTATAGTTPASTTTPNIMMSGLGTAPASSGGSTMASRSVQKVTMTNNNFPVDSSVPKNTNPKAFKSDILSSNTITDKKLSSIDRLDEGASKSSQKASSMSDVQKEKKNSKNNRMNPELNKDADKDDDEEFDNAADTSIKTVVSPMLIGCAIVAPILGFIMLVPMLFLALINPSSSSLSQIDCEMQQGGICDETEEETSFWDKLHNLFTYGTYGSNSEVVIKEIEDTYDKIKEEYDFIISLPLLTSSLFSDKEYVETDVNDGKITITDKMMDRVQYIYDMAFLQLIPRFHIYTCETYRNEYGYMDYRQSYQYSTEEEEEVLDIPTGVCGEDVSGGIFKEIEYFFDEAKYFVRLQSSEELDLVYKDYLDSDELLVNKIMNQYYIYKNIYKVEDEAVYINVPIYLEHDESINLSTPLKGSYSITSPFGMRTGEYAGMHNGIDLVSSDKNIYAAGTGIVTRSNVEKEGGNVIEITHTDSSGRKYVTQYAHLSERHVNVGDVINSGDVIGIMGDTGTMASGVHLHFSMWDKESGTYYNPRKLFSDASNY